MKKLLTLVLAAAALVLGGCASLQMTPEEKAAEKARIAQVVSDKLDACQYEITVDMMYPRRGPSQRLTSPYSLRIDKNKIHSYLPYFGVAYSVPYGGGKALNFDGEISRYVENVTGKRDQRQFLAQVTNDEDTYIYRITVYDNGRADIRVVSRNREEISFSGEMRVD